MNINIRLHYRCVVTKFKEPINPNNKRGHKVIEKKKFSANCDYHHTEMNEDREPIGMSEMQQNI